MVVIVIGPSASGKTTVGRSLADALGWPFVEGDDFHTPENIARMRRGIPLTDKERAPWLAALADVVKRHATSGSHAVMACSALKRAYRATLVPTPDIADQVRFVYLRLTRDRLIARLQQRHGHFFPGSLLDSQLRELEEPSADEPVAVLSVDASQSPDEVVAKIRGELAI